MPRERRTHQFLALVTLLLAGLLNGCASLMSSAAEAMGQNLSNALLNQEDPETVRSAVPAYLVLLDGLVESDPESATTLMTAARLNASYAGTFVDEPGRRQIMLDKAMNYAARAWCTENEELCGIHNQPFERFQAVVQQWDEDELRLLYDFGVVWAGYVEGNPDDWNAVAQIPKIAAIMRHVAQLDEAFDSGGAQLYLGVIESLVPPTLGGHPEKAKAHFERAIELSGGHNLMAKAMYAERYARLVFERELHDRLVEEVLSADIHHSGLVLVNVLAKERAMRLKTSADDYF